MTTAWLRDLEEKVQEASTRLSETRARNAELETQNETLRQQVEDLEARLAAAPPAEEVAAWTEERDDIRQRVEKLADHLGSLLEA
ncbi:MAG: cell division protein ZapB [Acidobacteriota bacterium]